MKSVAALLVLFALAAVAGGCAPAMSVNGNSPAASVAVVVSDEVITARLIQGSPWRGSLVIGSSYASPSFAFQRGKDGVLEGEFLGLGSVVAGAVPPGRLEDLKVSGGKVTFKNSGAPYQLEYTSDGHLVGHFIGVTGFARGQKGYVKLAPQGS